MQELSHPEVIRYVFDIILAQSPFHNARNSSELLNERFTSGFEEEVFCVTACNIIALIEQNAFDRRLVKIVYTHLPYGARIVNIFQRTFKYHLNVPLSTSR